MAERLEEIKKKQGDQALPINRSKQIKAKWRAWAKITVLKRGFAAPVFPDKLGVDAMVFCNAFPYHIVFDHNLKIIHSGVKVWASKFDFVTNYTCGFYRMI